jgi:peptide/nickel transport system substrate-binding protein
VKPLVHQIVIKGVPDITSFTSGMLTGAIQGSYYFGASTLNQLEHSSAVRVYQGPGQSTDALVVSTQSGPLANVKVRQALSLALNRQAIIGSVYKGAALMPRWLANPGTFGYGTSVRPDRDRGGFGLPGVLCVPDRPLNSPLNPNTPCRFSVESNW